MYIHSFEGFGDPQPTAPQPSLRSRKPPVLVFLKIDKFNVNQSALTPQLKQAVRHLADSVKASWKTMQPIGIVRLVGHTDSSGTEQHNVGLGNRRADAVRQELYARLGGFLNRVAIDIDPSPGKSKPTADNRTAAGRAANRRVDVFVEPPFVPAPKKSGLPWPPRPSDPDRGEPWDRFRFKRGMPDPLEGKTPRQFLMVRVREQIRQRYVQNDGGPRTFSGVQRHRGVVRAAGRFSHGGTEGGDSTPVP